VFLNYPVERVIIINMIFKMISNTKGSFHPSMKQSKCIEPKISQTQPALLSFRNIACIPARAFFYNPAEPPALALALDDFLPSSRVTRFWLKIRLIVKSGWIPHANHSHSLELLSPCRKFPVIHVVAACQDTEHIFFLDEKTKQSHQGKTLECKCKRITCFGLTFHLLLGEDTATIDSLSCFKAKKCIL